VEPARRRLGLTAAETAWAEGQAMRAEDALAVALTMAGPSLDRADPVARAGASRPDELTSREREVAILVTQGLTNRQIADVLVTAERTADTHVGNILGKLGLATRAQLAAWAVTVGLLPRER